MTKSKMHTPPKVQKDCQNEIVASYKWLLLFILDSNENYSAHMRTKNRCEEFYACVFVCVWTYICIENDGSFVCFSAESRFCVVLYMLDIPS